MEKFFLLSKTIQGILLMLMPTLATLLGFDWNPTDNEEIGKVLTLGTEAIGAALGVWGRFTAKAELKVVP